MTSTRSGFCTAAAFRGPWSVGASLGHHGAITAGAEPGGGGRFYRPGGAVFRAAGCTGAPRALSRSWLGRGCCEPIFGRGGRIARGASCGRTVLIWREVRRRLE